MDNIDLTNSDYLSTRGPFGDSDGTRAQIKEIVNGFINFQEFKGFSGLAFEESDRIKRIIIGKKGSGKTIYLRRIQDLCKQEESTYVTSIPYDPPSTRLIVKICEWSNVQEVSELWTDIWQKAIYRALFTHILYSENLGKRISTKQRAKIYSYFKKILPKNKYPVTIYSQLKNICSSYNDIASLNNYLDNTLWDDFESELSTLMKDLPVIYLFIDAVDEDYAHAPLHWLRCQKGLFYAVYRMLRNQKFGGRLHISICIRETILAHVYGGEHMSRYINDNRVKILSWDKKSIKYFLNKKIEKLEDTYFLGDIENSQKNLNTLLNLPNISYTRNGNSYIENIDEYIVRHTRLLPRDIVNIGNEICRGIKEFKQTGNVIWTEEISIKLLKNAISKCSKAIAIESIAWCSNQQTSNWMYNGAYNHYNDELYTSDQEMVKGVASYFRDLIQNIQFDRFKYIDISNRLSNICEFGFKEDDNPFNILWQFGLIGYLDKEGLNSSKEIFFTEISPDGFLLPRDRDEYVFHSVLIDLLNIKPIGKPVYVGN